MEGMCGRMTLSASSAEIARVFRLATAPSWQPRWNLAPTMELPVVRQEDDARIAIPARWGLIPRWAKDLSFGSRTFNARSETAAEKPAFRSAWRKRRCLVPTNGFYEWKRVGDRKQPWFITLPEQRLFAFAGLWETWLPAEQEQPLHSFTILTREANADLADLHDRMPWILLDEDAQQAWLDGADGEGAPPPPPAPPGSLEAWPVDPRVNRVGVDDARCVEAAPGQGELF